MEVSKFTGAKLKEEIKMERKQLINELRKIIVDKRDVLDFDDIEILVKVIDLLDKDINKANSNKTGCVANIELKGMDEINGKVNLFVQKLEEAEFLIKEITGTILKLECDGLQIKSGSKTINQVRECYGLNPLITGNRLLKIDLDRNSNKLGIR